MVLAVLAAALWGAVLAGPVEDKPVNLTEKDLPLPGRGVQPLPVATLYRELQALETSNNHPSAVTLNDLEKLHAEQRPPLRYTLPVEFQPVAVEPGIKKLTDYLPAPLVAILPSLPSLPSLSSFSLPHLPDFLPGLDFSASVHAPPTHLPHVPTPGEVVRGVTHLLDEALHRLYRKEEQLVELIKCACPRPAHCESLFQEFSAQPHGPPARVPPSHPTVEEAPALSVFAEVTHPNGGHGPGVGFYVDSHGPHLGKPAAGQEQHPSPLPPPPPPPPPPVPSTIST